MKSIYPISFFALILFILLGYWLKCQTGIDFLETTSLSSLPPFKYLQRNNDISLPDPGILLNDSFETIPIISNWSKLWMKDKGKVTLSYDSNGINNSHCLLIKSNSKKNWLYSHNKYVEVLKGDFFSFEGFVKLQGDKVSAYIGISAFDKYKKPIKWNYISEKIDNAKKWIKIKKSFIIPDDIKYISFGLSGRGIGDYKFDNIIFRKEELRVRE